MSDIKFKVNETSECIDGEIIYQNNKFIFESSNGIGEFSLMIGKGYCELTIARSNSRIYSFGGINIKEDWIYENLIIPNSISGELYLVSEATDIDHYDGTWYVENWNTYYDKNNNSICMGDYDTNLEDIVVEFCKNIIAVIEKDKLKSIWLKNIKFKK